MLDAKYIKDNLQEVADRLATRGYKLDTELFEKNEAKERSFKKKLKNFNHKEIPLQKKLVKEKQKAKMLVMFLLKWVQ